MNDMHLHPLSVFETIDTDGKKEVMNSWAFASILWMEAIHKNEKAIEIVTLLFGEQKDKLEPLLERSQCDDKAAIRQAQSIIAFALEGKISITFKEKNK